jgi:UDP-N-acetylmuramate--alanine ligase
MDALKMAFLSFMNKVPFYGVSVVCIENEHLRRLLPAIHRRYITYGFNSEAQLYAENIRKGFMCMNFEVVYKGRNIGDFSLPAPGVHNVLNCLAAICVALILKMDIPVIREALKGFSGIQRRLEFKGEMEGIRVYDDYGHHPAEIKATLKAVKESLRIRNREDGRLIVLFQPHRYTRTKDLIDEFKVSFSDADILAVLDIYPAGEAPIEGVNSENLVEGIQKAGHRSVVYSKGREDAVRHVISGARNGDIILTLGAGNVWKLGEEILNKLKEKRESKA